MPEPDTRHPTDLHIGFAGRLAVIRCQDSTLRDALEAEFRHMLATPECADPNTLEFEVSGANGVEYSLKQNGQLVVEGLNAFDVGQRLLYELTLALAKAVTGSLVLHAAGLELEDRGVVLAGASGSGKSTLAIRLGASGARFLSDELVAIEPDGSSMVGFARPAALKTSGETSGRDWLSATQRAAAHVGPDGVVRIDPGMVGFGEVRPAARPAIAIFPCYGVGLGVELRPISRASALYRLLPVLINAASFTDRGLRALRSAVERIEAHELRYSDGEAAAAAIRRLAATA